MCAKRLHLRITGIVQGVCFRAYTRDEARRLGVTGWVRNREDGSVELVAEGAEAALAELAVWCEHGPPSAEVHRTQPDWSEATGEFDRFFIAR
jgi:acylphosphatase